MYFPYAYIYLHCISIWLFSGILPIQCLYEDLYLNILALNIPEDTLVVDMRMECTDIEFWLN